jgi:hypothetical protein
MYQMIIPATTPIHVPDLALATHQPRSTHNTGDDVEELLSGNNAQTSLGLHRSASAILFTTHHDKRPETTVLEIKLGAAGSDGRGPHRNRDESVPKGEHAVWTGETPHDSGQEAAKPLERIPGFAGIGVTGYV